MKVTKALPIIMTLLASTHSYSSENSPFDLESKSPKEFRLAWSKAGLATGYPKAIKSNVRGELPSFLLNDEKLYSSKIINWGHYSGDQRFYIAGLFVASRAEENGEALSDELFQTSTLGMYQCMNALWSIVDGYRKNFNYNENSSVDDFLSICKLAKLL